MATTTVTVGTTATSLIPAGADPDEDIILQWSGGTAVYVGDRNVSRANPFNPPWSRPFEKGRPLAAGETHAVVDSGTLEVTVLYTALPVGRQVAEADTAEEITDLLDLSGSYAASKQPRFLSASDLDVAGSVSPTKTNIVVGSYRFPVWSMQDAANPILGGAIVVPPDWTDGIDVELVVFDSGAVSGAVALTCYWGSHAEGDTLNGGMTAESAIFPTVGAQYVLQHITVAAGIDPTPGEILQVNVLRTGGNASDTYAAALNVRGLMLRPL